MSARSRQAGFTLIELIVTLAIMALALGAVALSSRPGFGVAELKATAVEIATRMRLARAAAIGRQAEQAVLINTLSRRVVGHDGGAPLGIPRSVDLSVVVAEDDVGPSGTTRIRFFANGGSTGGVIRLAQNDRAIEIRVNWLTGRVAVTP